MVKAEVSDAKEYSAVRRLAFIELNVVLMVFAAAALVVFGSCRRRCSNKLFDKIQWINYCLVTTLVFTLTIGQMQGAPYRNGLFAVWGMILLITSGGADCFSAYSPADNEQWRRYSVQILYQSWLVGIFLGLYVPVSGYVWIILAFAILFTNEKTVERATALKMATKSSLAKTTKYIADFMAKEHEISADDGEPDPTQMKGYNYLVSGDTESKWTITPPRYDYNLSVTGDEGKEVVTLQKIWQCRGVLLTGKKGEQLKDTCLSFALFRLLCRKFGGHPFLESSHDKTWRLVRDGLLSDYKRAFRVIEVELSFLFYLFYTKYAVIFKNGQGFKRRKFLDAVCVLASCGIVLKTLESYSPSQGELGLITANGRSVDMLATVVIVVIVFLTEIAQLLLLVVSDWATVLWICNYVRGIALLQGIDSCIMFWAKIIMFYQDMFKPWERKLGQYSLLKSFNRNPCLLKFKRSVTCCFGDIIDIPRPGQKGRTQIELPEEVKKAVMLTLGRNDSRKLSNGEESLHQNEVLNEFSWACRLETPTHVILVWHVATSLCMIKPRPMNSGNEHFIIATALSEYCSYLVAFAPRLICDNAVDCEFIFDSVIREIREILKNCKSEEDKYKEIMKRGEEGTISGRGAKLAIKLQNLPNGRDLWKVLADFWVELLLFLAPCGDSMAHVEHLAKGGEFVTHLWALLSHAGILDHGSTLHDV